MRSDGALEPHRGAAIAGSSPGVKKYRDKQCESFCDAGMSTILRYSEHYNNNNWFWNRRDRSYIGEIIGSRSRSSNTVGSSSSNSNATPEPTTQQQRSIIIHQASTAITNKRGAFDYTENDFATSNFNSTPKKNAPNLRREKNNNTWVTAASVNAINAIIRNDAEAEADADNDANVHAISDRKNPVTRNSRSNAHFYASLAMVAAAAAAATATASSVSAKQTNMAQRLRTGIASGLVRMQHALTASFRSLISSTSSGTSTHFSGIFVLYVLCATVFLSTNVSCDDSDTFFAVNSFSMGPETTTPEFDYVSRGKKKFGDKCENTLECGFPGSICDPKKKSCQCTEDLPVTNHIDKCGKEAAVNESCFFNEQCEVKYFQTECRDGRCACRFEMSPIWGKDGSVECKGRQDKRGPETYIDPAMIGVLVGMALMFVIICVVLRLFSQARWRENRTIFNTPNPRLMNVSLLRDSKLLHGQERRGSRMSVRAPSRQPSMASLRPHSPNPSLGSRSGSGNSASVTSLRSTRSNSVAPGNVLNSHHERKGSAYLANREHKDAHTHHAPQQPLITNITANPTPDSVTVEIIEPEK